MNYRVEKVNPCMEKNNCRSAKENFKFEKGNIRLEKINSCTEKVNFTAEKIIYSFEKVFSGRRKGNCTTGFLVFRGVFLIYRTGLLPPQPVIDHYHLSG